MLSRPDPMLKEANEAVELFLFISFYKIVYLTKVAKGVRVDP